MRDLKLETTIESITRCPEQHSHALLFAVIIDVSEPTKADDSSNFNTKLKVIDPSFNYKTEVKNPQLRFHKFVHINVYTEKTEEAPKISHVGDIIRLRRFKFKYTNKGELMGNDMKFSNWLIYPCCPSKGKKGAQDISVSFKNYDKNIDRALTLEEANRVSDLRKWSEKFFGNYSLMYINWWIGYKEVEGNKKGPDMEEKIDLILKVTHVESGKKPKLSFIDRENRSFELFMGHKIALKVGDIIKLRAVNVKMNKGKETTRTLSLSDHSSCLQIPPYASDYKQFDKAVQEQKKSPMKSLKTIDPFINDYHIEDAGTKSSKSTPKKGPKSKDERYATAIKKNFGAKKWKTVDELHGIMKSASQNLGNKYMVKGYIQDLSSVDPKEIIKFMHIDDRKVFNYGEKLDHIKKIRCFYNFVIHLRDESMSEHDQPLIVYVLTGDFNSHMFTNWKILPEFDEITAWQNLKPSKLNEFQRKLEGLKSPEVPVRVGLELNITKRGEAFFKLTDTIFIA